MHRYHDKIAKLLPLGQVSMLSMNIHSSLLMSLRKTSEILLRLLQHLRKRHLLIQVLYPIFTQAHLCKDSVVKI